MTDNGYFNCSFEEDDWRLRVIIHKNEYLFLYEVEPEDRSLHERFGVKFITQPRNASLELKCNLPIQEHSRYEEALLKALRRYLISVNC